MTNLDQLCVNAIRFLAADGVEQAKSGHPGMPMGMADAAYVLWTQYMAHSPSNPTTPATERSQPVAPAVRSPDSAAIALGASPTPC